MTPIQTNKPVFFDLDGTPLHGGEIYIGQPGTDPRTNEKTVTFRDSGGSEFTAKQPLNTKDGRIVYNGKPIVSLVDGEYSMQVFNSSGVQVDYSRSINEQAGGSQGAPTFSDVARLASTLAELKALDVSPGDVVENVGKDTLLDEQGAEWAVISNSGDTADDKTLINFDNGLQGRRISNDLARTPISVWTGDQARVSMTELSSQGPGLYTLIPVDTQFPRITVYVTDVEQDHWNAAASDLTSSTFAFYSANFEYSAVPANEGFIYRVTQVLLSSNSVNASTENLGEILKG